MFKTLFHYSRVISRHADAPLAGERISFLSHLASRSTPRSTLLRYARQLRVIAAMLDRKLPGQIQHEEIARYARRWAQRQQRQGHAQSLKWPAEHFVQVASAWCIFMKWLKKEPAPVPVYASKLDTWAWFLRSEEQFSERTVFNYRWWADAFLQWLEQQEVPLRRLTLTKVDAFMHQLSSKGLSRVTIATAAKVLRRFLHDAYQQGWCRKDLASVILCPRLFRQEDLPAGPAWPDVQRLIAATNGPAPRDLRNRAILLLLAVYGLRSGEVRTLCLEDLDWSRRVLRIRRSKTTRVQEYPLTITMGQALRRYLKKGRPECARPELFLTLHAPFGRLSPGALYRVTHSLMDRLEIASLKRGPHALRHACATYLLNQGFSLKKVGDHLGHRSLSATQIYAKVDLAGLRAVAAFDLGGLL
jgi:integrase/recombinase XerD